ncbi:MAG: phosphoribosylformylglycinamidine cyclo-ligase [Candidatus Micrarchaeota archaeon]|nr:phosphoribosylformylglycinamidine cyclo-ligase [Candidatus Micrarchaeota archaeon]
MAKTYAEAGVDIQKVKRMQAGINELVRSTHNENVVPIMGHYAGMVEIGGKIVAMHTDSVGTKVLVAQELGKFDTVGIDCVAMNVNDIICVGARPVGLVDYIAIEKEDASLVSELMKGLVSGAKEAECPILGGETAIMPDVIKAEKGTGFDLAASCIGVVEKDKVITGEAMKEGDFIVGLESSGVHSNGLTLARVAVEKENWSELLTPTKIYVKPVMEMLNEIDVRGIAHITGGAFSKMMRIGEYAGVGFLLDAMPKPPKVFRLMMESGIDDREMYTTFNMGIGMCVVCPEADAEKAIHICGKYGVGASVIGEVSKEQKVILDREGEKIELSR